MACPKCGKEFNDYEVSCLWCSNCNTRFNSVEEMNPQTRVIKEQEDAEKAQRKRNIVLSTCNSIDGYYAKYQLGLVFGEVLFKNGFFKTLGAGFDNVVDGVSFGSHELSGTSRLLNDSREYAMNKMIDEAVAKGANAIIGIDTESSFSSSGIVHISMSGTAVYIEPLQPRM